MDKDLAVLILSRCFLATRALGEMAPLMQEHGEEQDIIVLRYAVGRAIYDIMKNIGDRVGSKNPEAYAETEGRLSKYGRAT